MTAPTPPHRVRVPVNVHHWDDISFLHWPCEPERVQQLLPAGLRVLTHRSAAWIGVTPFFIRIRPGRLPFVPPGWAFPETNLRTYVVGPDGGEGIWFLRMEVTARWFVASMRAIGLPYVRTDMDVGRVDERRRYRSQRVRSGGGHDIEVRPGEWLQPRSGGPTDVFLTARWSAYHRVGGLLLRTPVEHRAWELRRAVAERCEVDGLFASIGMPAPVSAPIVHCSPGMTVRVGVPSPVGRTRREAPVSGPNADGCGRPG